MPEHIVQRIIKIGARNVALRLERMFWRELKVQAKSRQLSLRELLAAVFVDGDSRSASAAIRRKLFMWRGAEIAMLREENARLHQAMTVKGLTHNLISVAHPRAATDPAAMAIASPPARQAWVPAAP